jgi:hypothetical protein
MSHLFQAAVLAQMKKHNRKDLDPWFCKPQIHFGRLRESPSLRVPGLFISTAKYA